MAVRRHVLPGGGLAIGPEDPHFGAVRRAHAEMPPAILATGVAGDPTDGPIYGGPCCPRTGSRDDGPWPHLHRVHDRLFDAFYRTK